MYKQDQIWTAIREKLITSPPPEKRVIPRHGSHDGTLGQVHKMETGVKRFLTIWEAGHWRWTIRKGSR